MYIASAIAWAWALSESALFLVFSGGFDSYQVSVDQIACRPGPPTVFAFSAARSSLRISPMSEGVASSGWTPSTRGLSPGALIALWPKMSKRGCSSPVHPGFFFSFGLRQKTSRQKYCGQILSPPGELPNGEVPPVITLLWGLTDLTPS